eukprot:TRINITY_DN39043_c0_g1_i1.p1 TRINITY_DN39043_c0_g1~~TRINITY_DN39043_c0_g1_i1.p1  ORF type:complete len:598 (-),score=141.83 TRINITY_DN39043_c0_g1_i1:72-1865(-)
MAAAASESSSDGEGMTFAPDLPKGITKEILREAPPDSMGRPRQKDEASFHYEGRLPGSAEAFCSSRGADGKAGPVALQLGKKQMMKGWEHALVTMRRGELSRFTISRALTANDGANVPGLPEEQGDGPVVYDLELVGYVVRKDFFRDGGVVRVGKRWGTGLSKPRKGDEVHMTLRAWQLSDGAELENLRLDYVLGSGAFGELSKVVDKALSGLTKGGAVTLECSASYAYGDRAPDGSKVEVSLDELYEVEDISWETDGSVMKKRLVEPQDSCDFPEEGDRVQLLVAAPADQEKKLSEFVGSKKFVWGNGEVAEILEMACRRMGRGERATVTWTRKEQPTMVTVTLVDFEAAPAKTGSDEEKMGYARARKDIGAQLVKDTRYRYAYYRYECASKVFSDIMRVRTSDFRQEAEEAFFTCNLNMALCLLKLNAFHSCINACNLVLKARPNNVKALFRRASAHRSLDVYDKAISDLKKVLELDPKNSEARRLLDEVKGVQREIDKNAKAMYTNMCKTATGSSTKEARATPAAVVATASETENSTAKMDDQGNAGTGAPEKAAAAGQQPGQVQGTRPPPCFSSVASALLRFCGRSAQAPPAG